MQLDYNDLVVGVKGGLADAGYTDIVHGVSDVAVAFGLGLEKSSTGLVRIPAATGFLFGGIAIMKHKAQDNAATNAQYDAEQAIPVIRKGRIYVNAEQAVNPTLPVFLRHTVNGGSIPGDFRIDADTANADDISAFAQWVSVTTSPGIAILEVHLP